MTTGSHNSDDLTEECFGIKSIEDGILTLIKLEKDIMILPGKKIRDFLKEISRARSMK